MAEAKSIPLIDPAVGLAALEEDLPRVLNVLDAPDIGALGWWRPTKLALLIPMSGTIGDDTQTYLLRLGFHAYRSWPPSAQFVNPKTLEYSFPTDQHHVPMLRSSECHTHTEYNRPGGGKMQLICCSATLEFYEVLHDVQPHHVWQDSNTFLTTIVAIQRAFASAYHGRFPEYGK